MHVFFFTNYRTLSHVICFVQKLSGDAFEAFEGDPNAPENKTKAAIVTDPDDSNNAGTSLSPDLKRSASQGSLHSTDNDNLLSTARQESKNRLSFKMVRQTMKVSVHSLAPILTLFLLTN